MHRHIFMVGNEPTFCFFVVDNAPTFFCGQYITNII